MSQSELLESMACRNDVGHEFVRFLAEMWEAEPMQLSTTICMVEGMPGSEGRAMGYETCDPDVAGTAIKTGSEGGGCTSDGTTHDGIRWLLEHRVGHSEGNDGRSTPHSSHCDPRQWRTENR